jgi:hypothetical protein
MGNVFTTLESINLIGGEVKVRNDAGGCGKNRQDPFQTDGVCPAVRIQNVMVRGAK